MSRFEYLTAFVTIVLGLGVSELLLNLNRLFRARDRVRWHWLPLLWAAIVLLLQLNFWYGFYVLGQLQRWETAWFFTLFLAFPVLVFLISASVLPAEVPEQGVDLLAIYFRDRGYFFSLLGVYYLGLAVAIPSLGVASWTDPAQRARVLPATLFFLLPRTQRVAPHAGVAVLVLFLMVARLFGQQIR